MNNVIAIIGKPNVGKSTLFNRLVGKRHSIVSPIEGVTRDRIHGEFNWLEKDYTIIDTGGYIPDSESSIEKNVRIQAEIAFRESDVLLFVVDIRAEITSADRILSKMVIESDKPYILVANKADHNKFKEESLKFFELGLGNPILISAQNSLNIGDMLDLMAALCPKIESKKGYAHDIALAIVGMPNVGKSSMMNAILKNEVSIVTDIAGTTRDAVDSYLTYFGKSIKLIDTAGLRKKAKVKGEIEFYSTNRTYKVIDECDIATVLIDASKGFTNQDQNIIRYVIDKGKGMIIVVNKWDLIEKDSNSMKNFTLDMLDEYPSIAHYPIIFTSVLENKRLQNLLKESLNVFKKSEQKIQTPSLNEFIKKTLANYPPPAVKGKNLAIKYGAQVNVRPSIFVFFSNFPDLFPISYKRYIENSLRKNYDLKGVSLKISFRKK